MKFSLQILGSLLIMFFGAVPALTAVELETAVPVEISADRLSHDQRENSYHAAGNVRIIRGDITLAADEVWLNYATGEARALGDVRLSEGANFVTTEEIQINIETGTGSLHQGRLFFADRNLHVTGERIEKLGPDVYHLEHGTFTTCDGERPDWKFSARDLKVTLDRYAKGRDVRFHVLDVPVFYSPYLFYPVKQERESGFLMPRYGHSERRGFELSLAWYQVLARNQDATLFFDYFSDLGTGVGVDYRYIFGEENEGELGLYYLIGSQDEDNRYHLEWDHDGRVRNRVRLAADVEVVSDRDYFEDFGEQAGEYNRDKTESKVYASRSWGRTDLTAQVKYLKNIETSTDDPVQRLPEVSLAMIRRPLAQSPFFFSLDVDYAYLWQEEGTKGQRAILQPAVAAVFHPGDWLELEPQISFQQRLYHTSGDGVEQVGIPEFSTRLSTTFGRVFTRRSARVDKLQHLIHPEIIYRYVPSVDQSDLPFFEKGDRFGERHQIVYALTNRVRARLQPADGRAFYRELLYLRLSQEYDIVESPPDPLNPRDNLQPFSDLRTELILRPTRWGYLDLDARYDFETREGESGEFAMFNLGAGIDDGRGNALSGTYRFRRDEQEYLDARLDVALLRPVYANYLHRYDLQESRTLEKTATLEYRSQCWSLYLTLRDRLEDTEVLVSFALSGVGSLGQFGGSLSGQ